MPSTLTRLAILVLALAAAGVATPRAQAPAARVTAITGATLIDGTGGAPVPDAVVVVTGDRITAAGPRASVPVPAGATIVDAAGQFIVPGFIDTNVHLSLYGGVNDRYETLVRYNGRQPEIVLEAAQLQLKHGVTTVRDSYGVLPALVATRDRINRGDAVGARILAAGNIVGWGGPYSVSFSLIREAGLTLFQEQMNDQITQGAGEDLLDMTPDELRTAINAYLDKGPDFVKFGGTAHFARPSFIGFSPEAQRVMVEEAHKRGKKAETHSTTPDGLRLSVEAGIDGIQHPEMLGPRELPAALIRQIVERQIACNMLVNTITGDAWAKHLKDREAAQKKLADDAAKAAANGTARAKTSAERRKEAADTGEEMELRRRNARALIAAGAVVTVGTDNYWAAAAELARAPKVETQDHGIGTILAIEGLVELGMTPLQALVAGTKNGAFAAGRSADLGTIERGKIADLLVLGADPLADIRNIRAIRTLMAGGRVVDRGRLPEVRVLSRP
ncbi:MAG: amidohydrolase family protein [Acidobacteria bacterium]|nr:amidohydrolase family protein [Acidobacteriota bacterium]